MAYLHKEIEPKWQNLWEQKKTFTSSLDKDKPKYYVLDMFPYPSSQGLHVGHPEGYTATDIVARYKRCNGFNVLHPMGWDAFGLPAEQYAIQTGVHPAKTTAAAIENFRRQLRMLGFSYDWGRELSTCDPKFYKWTQFIFTKLFEMGLAYQKEVPVNWCPALRTVLANEEVVDGKSERGGHPVVRLPMKQWMLKITAYAERLLAGLDTVDWPERTKEAQRNWIGKSEGARLDFRIQNFDRALTVFSTRPDTIFGATFMVLAPEHPFVDAITTAQQKNSVQKYKAEASRKLEVDRQIAKEKTGVFTGAYAINPFTQKEIPIWIADYVLMGYGTGAIMAVPGHDVRDFEFATAKGLPIIRVITSEQELPHEGEGSMINSGPLDGMPSTKAVTAAIALLVEKKLGEKTVQYKLRDWLFSRQRYWGEPFPVVHIAPGELKTLPLDELPVLLPSVADYEPSDKGESPLARAKDWVNTTDPKTGKTVQRETDTMPGSAGSSWYFLRYLDPHNDSEPFSQQSQSYWMPVDLYIGGPEHSVGHLLYSRFWQKVLFDCGLVSHDEPFKKLVHQGMILGTSGEKMSKSRGNVINPDIVIDTHGADSLRVYEMFMGPLEKDKPWSDQGIEGVRRFLDRVWRLIVDETTGKARADESPLSREVEKTLHKTIKKVTEDIESLSFNTAISQMMIFVNEVYKADARPRSALKVLVQVLAPFAPHLAEELWQKLGGNGFVSLAPWPKYNPALVQDDIITLGVQVNGKMRGTIELSPVASESEAVQKGLAITAVQNALNNQPPSKIIYKAARILNLISARISS